MYQNLKELKQSHSIEEMLSTEICLDNKALLLAKLKAICRYLNSNETQEQTQQKGIN